MRQREHFRAHPTDSDAEYLLAVFGEVARLPGLRGLYDPGCATGLRKARPRGTADPPSALRRRAFPHDRSGSNPVGCC